MHINVHLRLCNFFQTSMMSDYLVKANHPKATDIMDPVIKILKMSWRTEANFVDCGVFAMRHMEVYKGNGTVGFDTGFLKEDSDQKKQLDGLRVKFLTKLLLSDLNMIRMR